MMNDKTLEIDIQNLVYGGEGLGRLPDGKAIFIPGVLPGERVAVRIQDEQKGFAKGELLEVLKPSNVRIAPRCPHFGVCGGCHYQHIPYAAQLQFKKEILQEQFTRIGRLPGVNIQDCVHASQPFNYRNTIQFHLTPQGKVGFQAAGTHRVVEVKECHLPVDPILQMWQHLQLDAMPGLERLEMRCGNDDEILLVLESQSDECPEFETEASLSAVFQSPAGQVVLAGDDHLTMDVAEKTFMVSAGSFFQVNLAAALQMVQHLEDVLEIDPAATLMDLYCGVGLFSAFFAPRVKRCLGVESSPSACRDFAANLDAYDHVELYQGTAEEVLPLMEMPVDILLADPPRSGLGMKVMREINRLNPHLLAYVSCDPATLARDARFLVESGYELQQVTPFDLFPQTFHIESISIFKRKQD
jgi:23S rRNA (uracil1939-C5)-methyltransferase